MRTTLTACTLVLAASCAAAGPLQGSVSGAQLTEFVRRGDPRIVDYVAGAADATLGVSHCMTATPGSDKIALVLALAWVRDNPRYGTLPAGFAVAMALHKTYPCEAQ